MLKAFHISDYSFGLDNNSPATMLDPKNVADAKNFNLTNKKGLSKRGGCVRFYATTAGSGKDVEGIFEYKSPQGTNYNLIAIDTKIRAYFTTTTGAIATLTFNENDPNPDTIVDSNDGFLTAGFQIGDTIIVSGSTSNDGTYTIATVIAGTITLDAGDDLTYEAAGGTDTITCTGWHDIKSSLTTALNYSFVTHLGSCYSANGTNANFRIFNKSSAAIGSIASYNVGIPVPAAAPTVALGTGTLSGDYYYKYCYYRKASSGKGYTQVGNPSDVSSLVQPTGSNGVDVTLVASIDTNVTHIWLYRTLSGGSVYYKQGEHANASATVTDDTTDNGLSTLLLEDNNAPPKAKFLVLHKDRMFYLNCPDEADGEYLAVWSKSGQPEAVPDDNFQYFDRGDGEAITGGAAMGDRFNALKRNKISVILGDLDASSQLHTIEMGVGCIGSWGILPFEEKFVFLSEEGWKAFDGQHVYALSQNVNAWAAEGYITENENANYSAIYYPEKSHFQFLINHSSLTPIVAVGHFLIPLLLVGKGIGEEEVGAVVAWTYHQYDSHTLTALGTYTDSDGITRPIAGDDGGFIYKLDYGTADVDSGGDSHNIECIFQTDWLHLGTGRAIHKVCRKGYLDYVASEATNLTFNVEKNFDDTDDTQIITGTGGVGSAISKDFNLTGTGRYFRYTVTQDDDVGLDINGLSIYFRPLRWGMRG